MSALVESFRMQLSSGYDGLDEWVQKNVLYDAFESHEVEILQQDTVFIEPKTIAPSRFEDTLSYRVRRPTALDPNKYLLDVRANYEQKARKVDPDRVTPQTPSNTTYVDAAVLFRATVLIDSYGVRNNPEVMVVPTDE